MALLLNSTKTLKEQIPILLNLFQNTEMEGTLSNSFYKASITMVQKSDMDTHTHTPPKAIGQYP
jgi:hypothetical protein